MSLTVAVGYLVVVNILAFIIYTIDFHIYARGGSGIKPAVICNLITILGGSLGTLIAEFKWDPKIGKRNAQSRVYTFVWLILHVAVLLALFGPNRNEVSRNLQAFYEKHVLLCLYMAAINIATFIVFAIDKVKAIRGQWRIREIVLLGMSLLGGSAGALLAMDLCNHKVKSPHFMFGIPLMLCLHLVIVFLVVLGVV